MDCCICYEEVDKSNIIEMQCCNNTKSICKDCIKCLRSPLCPYCRTPLDKELIKDNKNISSSMPTSYLTNNDTSWINFLDQEHVINPYLYEDSRRLRRQMRRLRYEYMQSRTRSNPFRMTSRERRQERRNNRHSMRQQLRDYQEIYNDSSNNFSSFVNSPNDYHDEELGFEMEL